MTHKSLSMTVGLQIRKHRKASALSQEALALRCNIFRTYLSRIECGMANPSLQVLATIASVLDIDIVTLFESPDQET